MPLPPAKFKVGQRVIYSGLRGSVHRVTSETGAWLYVVKFDNGTGVFLDDALAVKMKGID